jgi:hypothetical protein
MLTLVVCTSKRPFPSTVIAAPFSNFNGPVPAIGTPGSICTVPLSTMFRPGSSIAVALLKKIFMVAVLSTVKFFVPAAPLTGGHCCRQG